MAHSHSIIDYPGQIAGIAVIAAAAGAITALLLSPKNGTQIRASIKRQSIRMKDQMSDQLQRNSDEAEIDFEKAIEKGKTAVKDAKIQADATTKKVKSDAKRTVRSTKKTIEHTPEEIDEIRRNGER